MTGPQVGWEELKDYFKAAGEVVYASVSCENGRSKGCGIVQMETVEEAKAAIDLLHETDVRPRIISCSYHNNITSLYGSSCANSGKGALNTPEALYRIRVIHRFVF